jgi:ribosomal protein S18 acetylase RimI-like enzyme
VTDPPAAPGGDARAVTEIERAGYATWTASESEVVDGWTLRSNGGFTRRLNSATVVGSADASSGSRERIRRWLADRGIPMTVRVTPLVDPATRSAVEATWDLSAEADSHVMAKTVDAPGESPGAFDLVDPSDPGFVRDVFALNERDPKYRPQWEGIVDRLGADGVGLWRRGVAVALVAVSPPTAFSFSVAVRPVERRRGIASDLMRDAEAWAGAKGATTIALQVTGVNIPAQALYRSLGYDVRYHYTYLETRLV